MASGYLHANCQGCLVQTAGRSKVLMTRWFGKPKSEVACAVHFLVAFGDLNRLFFFFKKKALLLSRALFDYPRLRNATSQHHTYFILRLSLRIPLAP